MVFCVTFSDSIKKQSVLTFFLALGFLFFYFFSFTLVFHLSKNKRSTTKFMFKLKLKIILKIITYTYFLIQWCVFYIFHVNDHIIKSIFRKGLA